MTRLLLVLFTWAAVVFDAAAVAICADAHLPILTAALVFNTLVTAAIAAAFTVLQGADR